MRSIAVMLLAVISYSALRASTDRVHEAFAVRSSPLRSVVLSISREDSGAPLPPSRRDPALESALDEEESVDLDPLDALPRGITSDPFGHRRPTPPSARSTLLASKDPCRPRRLRC